MIDGVSWWAGADSCFHWLGSIIAWWRLLVPSIHFQFSGLGTEVAWWKFLAVWVHFLDPSIWFHGCMMKVPGCPGLLLGSSDLVPWTWLPGCLVKVSGCLQSLPCSITMPQWLPGKKVLSCLNSIHGSPWTCFHGCLVKFPGCQSYFLIPWLPGLTSWFPGEGLWLPEFTSWFHWLGSIVASSRFLVPWTWFHDSSKDLPGCLDSVPVSLTWFPRLSWR